MEAQQSLERLAAMGGKARAAKLTPEQRRESARKAALKRWGTRTGLESKQEQNNSGIPTATHTGTLKIGDFAIECANLDNGTRVLNEKDVASILGRGVGGKTRVLARWQESEEPPLPVFLSGRTLEPYIPASLRLALAAPLNYHTKTGAKKSGFDATLINEICAVWVKADQKRALQKSQESIADRARILLKGLADTGIRALVDAATGYEKDRPKIELERILAQYISDELLPWAKQFPDEFYRQAFRLLRWDYNPKSTKRGKALMSLTQRYIYEQLPPGVYEEIKRRNPANEKGQRPNKNFQVLTGDIGNEHVKRIVIEVTTVMKLSRNLSHFKKQHAIAFPPRAGTQLQLEGDGFDESDGQAQVIPTYALEGPKTQEATVLQPVAAT